MQTAFTSNIILRLLNTLSQPKFTRTDKENSCFSLKGKNERKVSFFSVNTKNILSHKFTNVFDTFDEIYLVFTLKQLLSSIGICIYRIHES